MLGYTFYLSISVIISFPSTPVSLYYFYYTLNILVQVQLVMIFPLFKLSKDNVVQPGAISLQP